MGQAAVRGGQGAGGIRGSVSLGNPASGTFHDEDLPFRAVRERLCRKINLLTLLKSQTYLTMKPSAPPCFDQNLSLLFHRTEDILSWELPNAQYQEGELVPHSKAHHLVRKQVHVSSNWCPFSPTMVGTPSAPPAAITKDPQWGSLLPAPMSPHLPRVSSLYTSLRYANF